MGAQKSIGVDGRAMKLGGEIKLLAENFYAIKIVRYKDYNKMRDCVPRKTHASHKSTWHAETVDTAQ